MTRRLLVWLLLAVAAGLLSPPPAPVTAAPATDEGWLVASRRTGGQADLWAVPATGGAWQRLTETPGDERWPAFHPDGHTLAYAARRDRNWDLYTLDLQSGEETRRTTDPHFEGWPAWSPDGTRLAYASTRAGDADLFVLDLRSGRETNLTADSPAHDFEPRWEDNDTLLFVSTRDDSQDLYRLSLPDGAVRALTSSPSRDERLIQPTDRATLVWVREGRTSDLVWMRSNGALGAPFSWSHTVTSAALSPDGAHVAWLEQRLDGAILYRRAANEGPIEWLTGPTPALGDLAWGHPSASAMRARLDPPSPVVPSAAPTPKETTLVLLDDLRTEQPRINGRALAPFEATRARVLSELGSDFLGTVSETWRPIDFLSEESDYLSWHKAGRAVDTLFDLGWRGGRQMMEIVREDWHGDVYWRIWLRCPVQDGSCGEPLVEAPWDITYQARWEEAPGEGGHPKPFQAGYYVDFTRLAEDDGWERISSYETPTFDWRTNTVAMEYWHYQYTSGLTWYQAMEEVFSAATLNEYFDWATLRRRATPRWKLLAKGVPLPSSVRHAPAEIVVP